MSDTGPAQHAVTATPPTEPLAVVSVVSAVVGLAALPGLGLVIGVSAVVGLTVLPGLGGLVGIIAGHLALRRIRTTGRGGEGLARGGLVVGYIGVGIVSAVLIGLLSTLALRVGG